MTWLAIPIALLAAMAFLLALGGLFVLLTIWRAGRFKSEAFRYPKEREGRRAI